MQPRRRLGDDLVPVTGRAGGGGAGAGMAQVSAAGLRAEPLDDPAVQLDAEPASPTAFGVFICRA